MEIRLQFNSKINLRRNLSLHPEEAAGMTISAEEVITCRTSEEAEVKTRGLAQGFKKYIKSLRKNLDAFE